MVGTIERTEISAQDLRDYVKMKYFPQLYMPTNKAYKHYGFSSLEDLQNLCVNYRVPIYNDGIHGKLTLVYVPALELAALNNEIDQMGHDEKHRQYYRMVNR